MNRLRHLAAAGVIALALSRCHSPHAQLIVFDPNNYAQNVLTAARALQQINNQITSLQNQAQMLINQAKNLASLPYSSLLQLEQSIQRTQQLLAQAQRIAYDVQQIDHAFSTSYAPASGKLVQPADHQCQGGGRTLAGLQDALRVQAGVVGNLDTNRDPDIGARDLEPGCQRRAAGEPGRQSIRRAAGPATRRSHCDRRGAGRAQSLEAAQRGRSGPGREQLRRFLTQAPELSTPSVQMFHW